MTARRGPAATLLDGRVFLLLNPDPDLVDLRQIALSLSRQCRFLGHLTVPFYSVAQHSVIVSRLVPPELAMQGLMHDAAEALASACSPRSTGQRGGLEQSGG